MLISFLLNNLYPKVQFGSYVAGRTQQKACAISLKCCEVSIDSDIQGLVLLQALPHVLLVLTLFLLFIKPLLTTALLSKTLSYLDRYQYLSLNQACPPMPTGRLLTKFPCHESRKS